ncbi:MAG: alpha/beta fold hydrolase [Acidobacteriota bacterium]
MGRIVEQSGCPITYDVRGRGPAVLFIQGVGVHGDGWSPQIAELSPHYECVSFDNRGIGRSCPSAAAITVEQLAEDALAVMDAADLPAAHVVGHSLGGLVALQMALGNPHRLRSLSLLCTFAAGRDAAPLVAAHDVARFPCACGYASNETPWFPATGAASRDDRKRSRRGRTALRAVRS